MSGRVEANTNKGGTVDEREREGEVEGWPVKVKVRERGGRGERFGDEAPPLLIRVWLRPRQPNKSEPNSIPLTTQIWPSSPLYSNQFISFQSSVVQPFSLSLFTSIWMRNEEGGRGEIAKDRTKKKC